MVDRYPRKRIEIAKRTAAATLIGIAISYVTRTPLLMPIVASLISYAVVKSILTEPRSQGLDNRAEDNIEPILYPLSRELREGISPESALHLSTYPDSGSPQIISRMRRGIENGQPLSEVFGSLATRIGSEGERRALSFMSDALSKNSKKAGQTLLRSLDRIQRNRELMTERTMKVRSLLFRVKVLSVTCSITLALIVALLPILQWMNITEDWPRTAVMTMQGSPWAAAIVLSLTAGISSYSAANVALARRPLAYGISSFMIFWATFLATSKLVH